MSRVNIDVEQVACYLSTVQVDRLDGLANAVDAKMKELGVSANRKSHPKVHGGHPCNGNVRSVLRFVASLSAPIDSNALAAAEAKERGDKHTTNELAVKRYKQECERFEEDKKKLQALHAVLSRRLSVAGR